MSAGPYRNYQAEAGTKNEPDTFFVPIQKKGWKIDAHVSNLRSRKFLFEGFRSILKGGPEPFEIEIHEINGGPEPLEKERHEFLGSKRDDRFSNPFL